VIILFLRSTVFNLWQIVLTIFFAFAGILTFPFGPVTRYRVITLWNRTVVASARLICGVRWRIEGGENLPDYPVVVMAKHQSAWETIILPVCLPRPLAMVIKRELLRVPFFGWGMAMLSPIAIDRSAGREALKQIVQAGKARLAQGFWVLIFPEGTRMAPGEVGRYGIGGAWLATHTGTPVLPIAHNAGELWPKNAWIKHPGTITLRIGPPIVAKGKKPDVLNQEVQDWIETQVRALPHATQTR
jgi:1-acyl-sn-glycerol-3-phosphate acyltransferase